MKLRALLAAAALCGVPATASAFCRSTSCSGDCDRDDENCKTGGAPLYWPSLCVGFSLNSQSSEHVPFDTFQNIAQRAAGEWSSLLCPKGEASLAFVEQPAVSCHKAEYDPAGPNANIILCQDSKWNYKSADNTLAKTTVTFDAVSGEILDADIEVNHAYNEITTDDVKVVYDLQSILTHEFGHFVGLDHSLDFDATMNATYDPGTTELRTIEEDDVGGICTIYPPTRVASCEPTPRGGFADVCKADTEDSGCSIATSRTDVPLLPIWPLALGMVAAWRRFGLRHRKGSR